MSSRATHKPRSWLLLSGPSISFSPCHRCTRVPAGTPSRPLRTGKEDRVRYVKLGRTGLDVSPIALGCMTYGEPQRGHPAWSLGEEESRPLIKHAVEAGINF